jgi:hypothetical protein
MSVRIVLLGVPSLCAAAAAAIFLNLLLLGNASTQNDPIGRLTPRTYLPPVPHWTIRPVRGHVTGEAADD